MQIEPKINATKYKIKFTLNQKGQDQEEYNTEMCARILKVDEGKVCVEFTKVSGNNVHFHEYYNEITNKSLAFTNDSVFAWGSWTINN